MAQNVTIMGASYPDVPAVDLPKTGGGTARFADPSVTTAVAADVAAGKIFLNAQGEPTTGTGSGGSGGIVITDTQDAGGGVVRTITAVEISGTKSITANGTGIDVTEYAAVDVAVPTGGSGSDALIIEFEQNSTTGYWEPDKTFSEIQAAYIDGQAIVLTSPNDLYQVSGGYDDSDEVLYYNVSWYSYDDNRFYFNYYLLDSNGVADDGGSEYVNPPTGTKQITANGTGIDVTEYAAVDVNVPTGSSKALYKYEGLASRTANSYGATNAKVTVTKAGTYNVSYVAIRGSSSGTMGTNLYIGSTGKGNQQTWNNGTYGQYVSYTNQSIAANTDVTIYATSGNTSRTIYVGQLIVEEV